MTMIKNIFLKYYKSYFLVVISFIVMSQGQCPQHYYCGIVAATMGLAMFWRFLFYKNNMSVKRKFLLAVIWFGGVQLLQLSWMSSIQYQGVLILIVYVLLAAAIGIEFALLCFFIDKNKKLGWKEIIAIASLWTILEWSRSFFFCGFPWNPLGLFYNHSYIAMQLAAIIGLYGLSFWVVVVNLLSFKLLVNRKKKNLAIFVVVATFPYIFGICHQTFWQNKLLVKDNLSVITIDTNYHPEDKMIDRDNISRYIPPWEQWRYVLHAVKEIEVKPDLIVLPESAITFGAYVSFYPEESVRYMWQNIFGNDAVISLPDLTYPLAEIDEDGDWMVSNAYIAQALSNYFSSKVIIGLDDKDKIKNEHYNAAFLLQPNDKSIQRYEKSVLVPIGEYFPFAWCANIASQFGISDTFTRGTGNNIFFGDMPIGISICYEEIFGEFIRKKRKLGAKLFVNISNDIWFPNSSLDKKHFEHGRVRSVENGVAVIRSCNAGKSCGIDAFGKIIDANKKYLGRFCSAIHINLPVKNYQTLYSFWGDSFIVIISFLGIAFFIITQKSFIFKKKKQTLLTQGF
jgi:apolipoprotein N-acyltransferase